MRNQNQDRTIVESSHQAHTEAFKVGNVDKLVSLYSADAVLMPPNDTTLYGNAEIREWFEEYFAHFRITALGDTQNDVTIVGDYAIERGEFMVSLVPLEERSKRIRDDGRFLRIWQRQPDTTWKIAQSMWNSQKAIGAGTTRFMVRMMQKNAAKKSRGG